MTKSPALELKETLLAEVDGEKLQLDLRRQGIERNWQDTKPRPQHLEGTWDTAILRTAPVTSSIFLKMLSRTRLRIVRLDDFLI